MGHDPILFTMFLIFFGASILATLALFVRQSLLVVYVALGILCGPAVLGWVADASLIAELSHIGIVFLLFLLGMNLPPQKLLRMFSETMKVTLLSSCAFTSTGFTIAWLFGFSLAEALVIGVAFLFSSTIIALKLLPTTVLHHQRAGGTVISILLFQDVIAVLALLLLQGGNDHGTGQGLLSFAGDNVFLAIITSLLSLPVMGVIVYVVNRFVLLRLFQRYDVLQEYLFLLAIGSCLGAAQLASFLGLSYEIGAFMAGVALASSPISLHISERLKPLRDFFLSIFFFSIGAGFNPLDLAQVLLPAIILAVAAVWLKPLLFALLLKGSGETSAMSDEIGARLGQMSEFSLLISALAVQLQVIGSQASDLIELATLLSFVVSSWWVVRRYPTPMGAASHLFRD